MFEVVVERVAAGDTLDGAARERAQALRALIVGGAKDIEEVVRQKLAKLLGRQSRYRFHRLGLPEASGPVHVPLGGRPPTRYLAQARFQGQRVGRGIVKLLPSRVGRRRRSLIKLYTHV